MGREILFRGKSNGNQEWIKDGEWVEGLPMYTSRKSEKGKIDRILTLRDGYYSIILVDPETVCEYTGLTDKNGRKIFEGDILKRVLLPTKRIENNFRIAFVPVKSCFSAIDLDGSNVTFISDYINSSYEIEVIGNIFDNPELLEVHNEKENR